MKINRWTLYPLEEYSKNELIFYKNFSFLEQSKQLLTRLFSKQIKFHFPPIIRFIFPKDIPQNKLIHAAEKYLKSQLPKPKINEFWTVRFATTEQKFIVEKYQSNSKIINALEVFFNK